ncbi:hypothetical protein sos41_21350 [Alphaproteobacteria bacterium SO-S41]|nr:hypothetical protein sos41_21350 [Alphaproteobacteria bacterium SO-S41]
MAGKWVWHELHTPNKQRAVTFYEALFDWTAVDAPMPDGNYTIWQKGGEGIGGLWPTGGPGAENDPPRWLLYIESDDIDRDYARVTELGGKALTHITEIPGAGRMFTAEDPTGAQFVVMFPIPMEAQVTAKPTKTAKPKAKAKPAAKTAPAAKAKPAAKPAVKAKKAPKASPKAKPRKAALKAAKKSVVGLKTATKVARDTAAAKGRTAALKGRSQNNFRR